MKIILKFPQKILQNPLLSEVVLETGVLINIDRAFVDATIAEIVVDVPEGKEDIVIGAFRKRGVEARALDTPLLFDETECVQCGACVSVCPVEVFKFKDDRTISIDLRRCVLCRTCLTMCPHAALKLADV